MPLALPAVALIAGFTATAAPCSVSESPPGAVRRVESDDAAEHAAARWLGLVDEGRYEESWEAASEAFRANMTRFGKGKGFWERALETSRRPLGALAERSVSRTGDGAPMPGDPAAATKYLEVVYHSEFEHERDVTETVVMILDPDGLWRVYNYVIRRPS
jgi:Protein of unknown function (DUF4019)